MNLFFSEVDGASIENEFYVVLTFSDESGSTFAVDWRSTPLRCGDVMNLPMGVYISDTVEYKLKLLLEDGNEDLEKCLKEYEIDKEVFVLSSDKKLPNDSGLAVLLDELSFNPPGEETSLLPKPLVQNKSKKGGKHRSKNARKKHKADEGANNTVTNQSASKDELAENHDFK